MIGLLSIVAGAVMLVVDRGALGFLALCGLAALMLGAVALRR